MKIQKTGLACLLFLLLGAPAAFGAPAPEAAAPAAAAEAAVLEAATADVFSVSVLSRTDCDAKTGAGTAALSSGTCGHCGPSACWGQAVDTPCGADRFCRAVPGLTCIDQNDRCRCEA